MSPIATCLLVVALALPGDAESVRATLQGTIDDGAYQADLPLDAPADREASTGAVLPHPLGEILAVLVWILLGALALVVIVVLLMLITGRTIGALARPAARDGPGAAAGRVVAGAGRAPVADRLGQVLRLGEAGRYQEAVHVMLLAAIDHLSATAALRDSQTSREVAGAFDGDPRLAGALRHLVRAVEQSLFGGRPVTRDGYEACRRRLEIVLEGTPS